MKVSLSETEGCFVFHMTAETLQDAALLVRFGTNVTNEMRSVRVCAPTDGEFYGNCVLGKRKKADSTIARAR